MTSYSHAEAYPNIWYGIWSQPDGLNGIRSATPGWTWSSVATPMTDFPVMNANPDAMGLLGVLRVAGVEPAGDGLRIRPVVPGGTFILDLTLLRLDVAPGRVRGEYRAANDGQLTLHVSMPPGASLGAASIGGAPAQTIVRNGEVLLPLTFASGANVPFEVDFR